MYVRHEGDSNGSGSAVIAVAAVKFVILFFSFSLIFASLLFISRDWLPATTEAFLYIHYTPRTGLVEHMGIQSSAPGKRDRLGIKKEWVNRDDLSVREQYRMTFKRASSFEGYSLAKLQKETEQMRTRMREKGRDKWRSAWTLQLKLLISSSSLL